MVPQFVILPLAVLLVWLALVRGIKPLNQLGRAHPRAQPDDLSPLDHKTVPWKWRRWCRLGQRPADAPERFSCHAKALPGRRRHQLKTPLAGPAHAGRPGQREGTSTDELKQSLSRSGAPASAPRTPSTSCWPGPPRPAARR